MNLYGKDIKYISRIIEALDAVDAEFSNDNEPMVGLDRIAIVENEVDGRLIGWIVDEIGGSWSYREATETEVADYKK